MSRYLQRLATRNLSSAGVAGIAPAARSMSPIAEEDQRVGMDGFEDFQFGAAAAPGGGLEDTSGTAGDLSVIRQRKINNPIRAGKSAPQNFANAGPRAIGDEGSTALSQAETQFSGLDVPKRHFFERAPASDEQPDERFDEVVVSPHSQATGSRQPGGKRNVAGEITPNADPPAYWSANPRSTATSSYRAEGSAEGSDEGGAESGEIEASGSRLRRPSVASPQLLEPSPSAITSQQQRESLSSDGDAASDETEQGPRVVIGRINVEVVAPPVEPKTSATSRPGPLTAESVSVIGPLSRGVRSNLRLSLRHR